MIGKQDEGVLVSAHDLVALAIDATRNGDLETLDHALAAGVSPAATTPRGDSLLMLASYHGHTPLVSLLLSRGADPNQVDAKGQTPLSGVAFKGLTEVADLLVNAGARVDAAAPDGRTPLMMAAAFNRTEMVRWLLDHGACSRTRDASGVSAGDVARAMGAVDAAAVLATVKST